MNLTAYENLVRLWNRVDCLNWRRIGSERERVLQAFLAWWNTRGWQRYGRIKKREPDVKSGEPVPVYCAGLQHPIERKVK